MYIQLEPTATSEEDIDPNAYRQQALDVDENFKQHQCRSIKYILQNYYYVLNTSANINNYGGNNLHFIIILY